MAFVPLVLLAAALAALLPVLLRRERAALGGARDTLDDLRRRVAALEGRQAELRAENGALLAPPPPAPLPAVRPAVEPRRPSEEPRRPRVAPVGRPTHAPGP